MPLYAMSRRRSKPGSDEKAARPKQHAALLCCGPPGAAVQLRCAIAFGIETPEVQALSKVGFAHLRTAEPTNLCGLHPAWNRGPALDLGSGPNFGHHNARDSPGTAAGQVPATQPRRGDRKPSRPLPQAQHRSHSS